MSSYLPVPKEIREFLTDLLGRAVTISPGVPLAPTRRNPCTVGVYVDDRLQISALVCFDLALSAHAGAALGLVPVTSAEAAIEEGTLSEALRDNLHEVLNVAASLFNTEGATHLRLYDVHHAGAPVPPDVLARALTLGRREDLGAEVAGYGSGGLSVVIIR